MMYPILEKKRSLVAVPGNGTDQKHFLTLGWTNSGQRGALRWEETHGIIVVSVQVITGLGRTTEVAGTLKCYCTSVSKNLRSFRMQ